MDLAERCSNMRQLKIIHALFIVHGLHHNNYALSRLVAFCSLSPSGSLHYASLLLHHCPQPPNTFIYNTVIRALSRSSRLQQALNLFQHMQQQSDIVPDHHTFAFVLAACANVRSLHFGVQTHARVIKNSFTVSDNFVQVELVRLYADTGSLADADKLFEEIPRKDAVTWNVLMNGYLRLGLASRVLDLFAAIVLTEAEPDGFCVATGITACAQSGALQQGAWLHDYARKKGFTTDIFVNTSLIHMYAKCGCLEKAVEVFESMPKRNIVSWGAVIGAYAVHGYAKEALNCLQRMQGEDKFNPDSVTLLSVLSACSHSGLTDEGYNILCNMESCYGLLPEHEHYSCVVDLLSRAGRLEDAFRLVTKMPMKPLASVWGALFNGARMFRNIELMELAVQKLVQLRRDGEAKEDDGVYVQLSNAYLAANRKEDARRIRMMVGSRGFKKMTGSSLIEVEGETNEFVAGDETHRLTLQIYATLNVLHSHIVHTALSDGWSSELEVL